MEIRRFCKFLEFSKSKINKFPEFHNLKNERISRILSVWKTKAPKISKFFNCSSIRYSAHFAILQIQYEYLPFDINQLNFSIFISYFSDFHKFNYATFERSLNFKFETSVILKFYCFKF